MQAEIPDNELCAATEPGKIVVTRNPDQYSVFQQEDDMIFQAVHFILCYADNEVLQNVLETIESELIERQEA